MRTSVSRAAIVLAVGALAGCVSTGPVATPFTRGKVDLSAVPEEPLRAAAAEIERQVADANREPTLTDREGLVVDTPRIRQAVRTRAARIELVQALLDAGYAWERPNGRLWIIRNQEYKKATTGRRRDIDAITVNGENQDRWAIYEELLEANKIGQGGLSAVEQVFFEERKAFMKPGQKFEGEDGLPAVIP
jgi:hypothetical protein